MKHASIIRAMNSMTDEQLRRLADAERLAPWDGWGCLLGTAAGGLREYNDMSRCFEQSFGLGRYRSLGRRGGSEAMYNKPEHRFMRLAARAGAQILGFAPASVTRAINRVAREILATRALLLHEPRNTEPAGTVA